MQTILLVDDHPMFREGLTALLTRHPQFKVVAQANDGLEAERLAITTTPDIVLMDISMKNCNGIDASQRLKNRFPAIKILVLSMHASPDLVKLALQAGVDGYVLKESAAEELVRALHHIISGKRYVSGELSECLLATVNHEVSLAEQVSQLSLRERQVFQMLAEGMSNQEISHRLHLSVKTVETYRSRLLRKLHLSDLVALTKLAMRLGIIQL